MKVCRTTTTCHLNVHFEKQKPNLNHIKKHGCSVEFYKGNHIVYDTNHMLIGNIRAKRYTYLQEQFCKFYNIKDIQENEHAYNLWLHDLHSLIQRYPMKKSMDIYHYSTIDSSLLNCFMTTLHLKTYHNFNPLNVPIHDQRAYISKDDVSYGSIERMPISNSYIKCNYSTSNTIKYIKKIGDSILNTSQPKRALITIPLLNNKSLDTITRYASNYTLLGIIPEGSMYLNPSDHWFDSEKVNLLNRVPIAICLYCNDLSLQIHRIQPQHFEKIEHVLNHNLLPNMKTKIILPRPPTIEPIKAMVTNASKSEDMIPKDMIPKDMIPKDIIYTDASIRMINDTKVSGIGIWCGPNDPRNISQRIVSKYSLIDINYCELIAIYVALINSHSEQEVIVYTDSLFALKLIEEGSRNIENIQKVKYREIVSMIVYLVYNRMKPSYLMKVSAHQGYIGNENADIMAKMSLHTKDAIYVDDLKSLQYTKRWSSHFMMIRKWWI